MRIFELSMSTLKGQYGKNKVFVFKVTIEELLNTMSR